MSTQTQLSPDDTIRLITQFLRENNLTDSLETLQAESCITFNAVENKDTFVQDIVQGRWDTVLRQIAKLTIPDHKRIDLYEQVLIELAEQDEWSAAEAVFARAECLDLLRVQDVDRYMRIQKMVHARHMYAKGMDHAARRQHLASDLAKEVTSVAPSRLFALLGQSLKWEQQQGGLIADAPYDVFQGTVPVQKEEEDAFACQHYCTIKFPGKKAHAEHAVFSPDGQYLATASVDGFIEIWNYMTGKLRKDLHYQAEDMLMAMDKSVVCLAFSQDSSLLASGSTDGHVAIWKVQTGACQRRITPAHSQGVTSLCFNKEGTQILSGGYDHTVKLHGLKSGKLLKEFRGHTSFVNSTLFSQDNIRVLSASSDGTVKIWDTKTTHCLHTLTPQPASSTGEKMNQHPLNTVGNPTVQQILPFKDPNQFLVCNKSSTLYVINLRGQIIKQFSHNKKGSGEFVACGISPRGELVYGVAEDGVLYCFRTSNGKLVSDIKMSDREILGLASHPLHNVMVGYDDVGHVLLYRA